jgi:hypothetical protein
MRFITRQLIPLCVAAILIACSNAPVQYNSDNPGPILHYISTDPAEIFRNKVDQEAELEARGVEPPVGNASWHEYWTKLIAYFSGENAIDSRRDVMAYVVQQRRARGLAPL